MLEKIQKSHQLDNYGAYYLLKRIVIMMNIILVFNKGEESCDICNAFLLSESFVMKNCVLLVEFCCSRCPHPLLLSVTNLGNERIDFIYK